MRSGEDLIQRSIPFLREVKDMTPGADIEKLFAPCPCG
jgi:hypothetical protein